MALRPKPSARWSLSTFDDSILLGMRRAVRGAPAARTPAAASGRRGRWAWAGALAGALLAGVAFAPAAWLAQAVASASGDRLLLAEAQGSFWQGSALPVLAGGPGSQDAAVLPSRLDWSVRPFLGGLRLSLAQDCCIEPGLTLEWRPGWGGMSLRVVPAAGGVGHWPAAWLEGLGAPWNTLRPGGRLNLRTDGLELRAQGGAWSLAGQAELDWLQASSRLSTLESLGSYRITLSAPAEGGSAAAPQLGLQTLDGALQLSGSGQWGPRGLRFRGQAQAAPGFEPALNNLLNIIGRRAGAASVISIG
ncbi:type II secretion system protein N [Ideonella sp.]|uniref:type II secretion system protein N n=1 Tax=Ideonella sp. TaxID=1929293 RepID=UPI0035AF51C5